MCDNHGIKFISSDKKANKNDYFLLQLNQVNELGIFNRDLFSDEWSIFDWYIIWMNKKYAPVDFKTFDNVITEREINN